MTDTPPIRVADIYRTIRDEGIDLTQHAIRKWIRAGEFEARRVGKFLMVDKTTAEAIANRARGPKWSRLHVRATS